MNKSQTIALISTLIVGATSATVAKLGIDTTNWSRDVEDFVLIGSGVAAWLYNHFFHKNTTVVSDTTGQVKSGTPTK